MYVLVTSVAPRVEGVGEEAGQEADFHGIQGTVAEPLADYPFEELCPGAAKLEELQGRFR